MMIQIALDCQDQATLMLETSGHRMEFAIQNKYYILDGKFWYINGLTNSVFRSDDAEETEAMIKRLRSNKPMIVPISYHATMITPSMVIDGNMKRVTVRVESKDQALEFAKNRIQEDKLDPMECEFGCLTVFSDGSISDEYFSLNDLEF